MLSATFAGRVDDIGHLHLIDRNGFKRALRSLAGTSVDLVLRRHAKHRSDPQHRFYWSVVIGLTAEHCGYLPEEMLSVGRGGSRSRNDLSPETAWVQFRHSRRFKSF